MNDYVTTGNLDCIFSGIFKPNHKKSEVGPEVVLGRDEIQVQFSDESTGWAGYFSGDGDAFGTIQIYVQRDVELGQSEGEIRE